MSERFAMGCTARKRTDMRRPLTALFLLTLFRSGCSRDPVAAGAARRVALPSSRQLSPGTSGIGEVISVHADEFEKLVNEAGVQVVKGSISDGRHGATNTSYGVTMHAGVLDNENNVTSDDITTTPKYVIAVNPEDSSRGTQQDNRFTPQIDRRKVPGKPDAGSSDLSFTGILNGLLDSFINDPPASPSGQKPTQSPAPASASSTTSPPQSPEEESSVQEEEEEEEEEDETSVKSSKQPEQVATEEEQQSNENVSEEPVDEDELEDYIQSLNSTAKPQTKQCQGECRNIIFGLFLCDEIDNDAFCPESGLACCVNNPEPEYTRYKPYGNGSMSSEEVTLDNDHDLDKIPQINAQESNEEVHELTEDEDEEEHDTYNNSTQTMTPPPQPPPPPPPPQRYNYQNRPPPHYGNQNVPPPPQYYYPPPLQKNPQMMMHAPPRMPLPCPRYCVKNYHEQYCSDRLPSQFACGMDAFCCSHPVNNVKNENKEEQQVDNEEQDDEQDDLFRNEGIGGQHDDAESESETSNVKKILGPCTEEVGSCVSKNIINIICFAHAIPTDMYTCPRPSMKCCARKTALPKDSLPSSTTAVPPHVTKLDGPMITRNASSQYLKPQPPPGPPQILPQFAPKPALAFPGGSYGQVPINPPTPPPLAETPPPPIQPNQFNVFTPTSSRVPTRQPVGQYVCGVKGVPTVSKRRRKKRVVGGSDSLPGEWCWQVALINSLNQYLCGGALIGTQWVLTAAHCVTNIVRSGDAIYVRVGDHDLTSRYGSPGAQTLRVATTYIHHNHNSQTLDNDIALLKLQGNAALKEGVCLVCLPSRTHMSEIPGKRCTVTGYGYMGESGPIPLRIREANLPIASDDECVRKVNAVTEKIFSLPQSSFCAGGDKSGNDACQGDGGGPLVCRADDPSLPDTGTGYYELTGLVSWGFGCGRESVPGVYVKVSSFIGWIHQIIRSN